MTYREFPAPPPLRGDVECRWSVGNAAGERPTVQHVLPDACMDLIWTGTQLLVAGPDTAPQPVRRVPGTTAAGLRFAPGRLPSLLGIPAAAVRDQRVALAELQPALARRAMARLEYGADPGAVLGELTLTLPGPSAEPGLRPVVAHLSAGRSATATAGALGWTTRSLHRRCLAAFGYGPAMLRRVLRFRRALALLQSGMATVEVAGRAGYADQPHLSREVRALAGMAPGQLASGANRSTPMPSGSCNTA